MARSSSCLWQDLGLVLMSLSTSRAASALIPSDVNRRLSRSPLRGVSKRLACLRASTSKGRTGSPLWEWDRIHGTRFSGAGVLHREHPEAQEGSERSKL